ncbi:MAG TPA: TolC family protein [Tenuifilaceae bacterium]|nr:TolC family protein [Tenuifilaceae bacterium]
MYKKVVLLFFGLLPLVGFTQQKWTLNRCILYSINNNLDVKNAEYSEEIAKISYSQSKWSYLPNVYAGSSSGMQFGRSVDPSTYQILKDTSYFTNSSYLEATLDLFNGFSQINKQLYQRFLLLSAQNSNQRLEDETAFSVMNAYYNVIYYEKLLSIAVEQEQLSKLNLKKTEAMVTAGLKSQADLLEIKANVAKDELFHIQTQNQVEAAKLNLRKAMNLTMDSTLDVDNKIDSIFIINSTDVNGAELFTKFSSTSPQLNSLEYTWKASLKDISVRKAGYYPSLQLSASCGTGYYETLKDTNGVTYSFNNQYNKNLSNYVGVSISIPIFSRNEVRFRVKQAKLISEQNKNAYDKAKQNLQFEILENVNALIAASKEFEQLKEQQKADEMAFDAAQKKYNKGMLSVVDLFSAKNRLGLTEANLLKARLTLEVRKRNIDFYKGVRFWESSSIN